VVGRRAHEYWQRSLSAPRPRAYLTLPIALYHNASELVPLKIIIELSPATLLMSLRRLVVICRLEIAAAMLGEANPFSAT